MLSRNQHPVDYTLHKKCLTPKAVAQCTNPLGAAAQGDHRGMFRRDPEFLTAETQKRLNTEPQGVPEVLDRFFG